MKKDRSRLALCLFFLVALSLRLVALDRFPAGFTADEAAQGYTAYSILKTGKDEWGTFLPISPRSFGDYKVPLQTYLMIPSISVFGLNELAVRLPNAILGSLGVLGVYLLVKELFSNPSTLPIPQPRQFPNPSGLGSLTRRVFPWRGFSLARFPLLAALLLTISPWHISLSRGAFEANLTTFLLPFGFWLFLKGLKKTKYLILAGLFFGLNLFSYHSAKLVTPLLVVVLMIWGKEGLIKVIGDIRGRKEVVLAGTAFGFFGLLAFWLTLTGGGARAADISIFSAGLKAPKIFLDNYFSYLSLRFLFTQGAGEATYGMIPGRGVLYLFELPLVLFALYSLIRKWDINLLPVLAWIAIAPIPGALSLGVGYHANRAAVMMPAIQILSAYGGVLLWERIKEGLKGKKGIKKEIYKIVILLYCCIAVLSFLLFVKTYFLDAPKINAQAMSYGWKEAMDNIKGIEDQYSKIVVSRSFSEPQAFVAFYNKWDPEDIQKQTKDWLRYEKEGFKFVDQLGRYNLGKYEFRDINFSEDKNLKKTLLVGKPGDFPTDASVQEMIVYPTGQRAFWIVDPEKQ